MDKSKWEYKKLGDICEVLDKLRKPVTKSDRVTGQYPYYGATGIQDYVADYIFDGRYLLLGEDGAKWGASDKSAFIIEGKSWVNNHAHILKIKEDYMDVFVMYYLNHKDLSEYITGAVVPKLTQAAMTLIPIPAVSFSDQQRIVAELDCLNEMIAVKQEQLKEFDKLAQSIFYDMFGDPVSNEKGWETNSMSEVCIGIGDGLHGTPQYDADGEIAFINGNNLIDGKIVITERTQFVNENEAKKIYVELDSNTILLSINGTLGKTAIYNNERVVLGKSACYLRLGNLLNVRFVMALMNTDEFLHFLENNSSQSTIKNVGLKAIRNNKIIIPPLSLQQQFADKISAIEVQKELLKQSIEETQALLDYTMDYYFNE